MCGLAEDRNLAIPHVCGFGASSNVPPVITLTGGNTRAIPTSISNFRCLLLGRVTTQD